MSPAVVDGSLALFDLVTDDPEVPGAVPLSAAARARRDRRLPRWTQAAWREAGHRRGHGVRFTDDERPGFGQLDGNDANHHARSS